ACEREGRGACAQRDSRESHRAADDAARPRERSRLRRRLGASRGRPRGDRARVPRSRRWRVPSGANGGSGAMMWVGWRQQRLETAIAAAMLVVLAAVAVPVGVHMASVYNHEGLSKCTRSLAPHAGRLFVSAFEQRFDAINILFTWSTILPAVAALLLAAPFVLDLDSGT